MRAVLFLVLLPVGVALQEPRPEDAIKLAIDAAGGADALTKFPAGRLTAKGTLSANGQEVPVAVEQVFHVPGRMRTVVRTTVNGQKQEVLHVVNGEKTRYAINGTPIPTTKASEKELQAAALLLEIGHLTPLLTDKRFALKTEKAAKGADATTVLVQVRGFPDVRLGFDRKTGQLVRVGRKMTDPDSGKDAEVEQVLSDFKAFGPLTRPTRAVLTRDGAKLLDLTTETFTPLEKVDPKEFVTEG